MAASLAARPVAGEFEAMVSWHGRIVEVRVQGALDLYSAREARMLLLDLLELEPCRLVVDTGDAFVDSCGIGVLVHVAQRARQERRDFRLICREGLSQILRFNRLDELVGVARAEPTPSVQTVGQKREPLAA